MTAGPWKPIRLETYATRIADLDIRPRVNVELGATIDIAFELSREDHSIASVRVKDSEGKVVVEQSDLPIKSQRAEAHFKLSPGVPELWYPVGYGKQPIYSVDLEIKDKVSPTLTANASDIAQRSACVGWQIVGQEDPKVRLPQSSCCTG